MYIKDISEFYDTDNICNCLYAFIKNNEFELDGFRNYIYTWDLEYIYELCDINSSNVYIMIEDKIIVGVLKIDLYVDNIYISEILISKHYRKMGFANHMIEYAMYKNRVNRVELNVYSKNTNALIAYLKMGFDIIGFIGRYYENLYDSIYMVKRVDFDYEELDKSLDEE